MIKKYLAWIAVVIILCISTMPFAFAVKVNYIYDNAGRLIRVNYEGPKRILYTYDSAGNLIQRMSTTKGTLEDAIYVLQVLSGSPPAGIDPMLEDKNLDGNLGLAEVILILQQVSGIK